MVDWGTKEWFAHKFLSEDQNNAVSYFAHRKNGYQHYRHRLLLSYLESSLSRDNADKTMLDVGCGMGDFSHLIYKQYGFKSCVGVDFVEPMLAEAASRYPEIQFKYSVLPDLAGLEDDSFDLVIASEVLYYLDKEGRDRALKEIFRVLKDDGDLLFSSVLDSGQRYFSDEAAKELVEGYLQVSRVWYQYGKLYRLIFCPIFLLSALRAHLQSETEPRSQKHVRVVNLFRTPVIGPLLRGLLLFADLTMAPLLYSRTAPRVLNGLSKLVFGKKGRTNIAIMARKSSQSV